MRLLSRLARTAIAGLIAIGAAMGSASAAEIIIVLDGSGSSAGQIGGVAKIDIARGALRSVLAGAPDDLSIGLVAYGHRQRETCGDIELIMPPGEPDAFLAAANGVRSVGRSPIAEATAAAAAALSDPDSATIIVITDNADNCVPDPCATISAIHDEMPGLTISVMGIAIPSNEIADIACFAELTGGLYLRAENAAGFQANLDRAFSAALVDPLPPLPTATIVFPGEVLQGRRFAVDYGGPLAAGDEIRIAWIGSPPQHHITGARVRPDGQPIELTAPEEIGAFELRYWHEERGVVLARIPLRVAAVAPALEVAGTVQQGADMTVTWHGDLAGGRTIQIAEPLAPLDAALVTVPVVRTVPTVTLTAPAETGTYEIRLVAAPTPLPELRDSRETRILARATFTVVAAEVTMTVEPPILAGTDFDVAWTGPGGAADEIRLARAGMGADAYLAAVSVRASRIRFRAPHPAGAYELRYYSAAGNVVVATEPIEVAMPIATLDAPETVDGGAPFAVVWTGPANVGDQIAITRSSSSGNQIVDTRRVPLFGRPVTFDAPIAAGTYSLAYLAAEGALALMVRQITVTAPSASVTAPTIANTGEAITIQWNGPEGQFDEIRILGPDLQNQVWAATRLVTGAAATLTTPSEPGRYRIVYWAGTAGAVLASSEIEVRCPLCEPAPADPGVELRLDP